MKRMISSDSEVETHRIQSGYLNREDWAKIGQATARLSDAPIYIDDSANVTMLQVRAKAQRLALEHGIDLLVVTTCSSSREPAGAMRTAPRR